MAICVRNACGLGHGPTWSQLERRSLTVAVVLCLFAFLQPTSFKSEMVAEAHALIRVFLCYVFSCWMPVLFVSEGRLARVLV